MSAWEEREVWSPGELKLYLTRVLHLVDDLDRNFQATLRICGLLDNREGATEAEIRDRTNLNAVKSRTQVEVLFYSVFPIK